MGIDNIHILIEVDSSNLHLQTKTAQQELLVMAHRRGEHPYGRMRRECPLCQLGK